MENLRKIERSRTSFSTTISKEKKTFLGQFFTPYSTSSFMSSLFSNLSEPTLTLLDPGAGIGSLSSAFIDAYLKQNPDGELSVDAIELDENIIYELNQNLNSINDKRIFINIYNSDFIDDCVFGRLRLVDNQYSNIILNPPYKKINNTSKHKQLLKTLDFDTVNLYSGFMLLAISKLKGNGELVAIIPRSFCNGVYYKNFRKFLLERTLIKQIHLIDSRRSAFQDDDVLQEIIIIYLIKKTVPKQSRSSIIISHSNDADFSNVQSNYFEYSEIIKDKDTDYILHIPNSNFSKSKILFESVNLSELNISVSTGPVVDFRIKERLSKDSKNSNVPLLYPSHFEKYSIRWPIPNFKKYNYIELDATTRKQLYSRGNYVLVKRFHPRKKNGESQQQYS